MSKNKVNSEPLDDKKPEAENLFAVNANSYFSSAKLFVSVASKNKSPIFGSTSAKIAPSISNSVAPKTPTLAVPLIPPPPNPASASSKTARSHAPTLPTIKNKKYRIRKLENG